MSIFKKSSQSGPSVGIYLIYDPAVPDKACKFSPPFFSPSDDVAWSAVCETLRRHSTSFEELYKSLFLRMDLWRVGSVNLDTGVVINNSKHRYKVGNVGEHLNKDYVKHYMMSIPYPAESEVIQ